MKPVLTTWLLLFGLLLQSVAWALPAQQLGQAERLAHQVAHALDHGHHQHGVLADTRGHTMDAALQLDGGLDHPASGSDHGQHHTHASEGVQMQGLPVLGLLTALNLPRSAPGAWVSLQPPSADLAGLLRPPQVLG